MGPETRPTGGSRRAPVLSWNLFPTADYDGLRTRITEVSYEVRIWKDEDGPESPTYSRGGLPGPVHWIEDMLEPDSSYVWAVRARYRLDGTWAATPWSTPSGWDWVGAPSGPYARIDTSAR
jgi:hypothetical protein